MQHTPEQLNEIWQAIQSGQQAMQANTVRSMAAPGHIDTLPVIVISDPSVQVLSVPTNHNTERAVYARKPSGSWVELP
jgi:hypothetical protein